MGLVPRLNPKRLGGARRARALRAYELMQVIYSSVAGGGRGGESFDYRNLEKTIHVWFNV